MTIAKISPHCILNRLTLIQTFYISANIGQNKDTSSSDMVTAVSRFRNRLTNIGQWRKMILLKGKRNSSWNGLFRNITIKCVTIFG